MFHIFSLNYTQKLYRSDAEISVELVHVRLQLRIREAVDDLAVLDNVVAIRDRRGEAEILLDQEDGETLRLQPRDGLADLLDDDGREPLGRLVQHQEPRAGAQDSRDREHLLLAARKFCTLAMQPFPEVRKEIKNLVERQAACAHDRRQQEVFAHVEARKNPALLG